MMNIIIKYLGDTVVGDKPSKRKTFFTIIPLKLVEEFQNKTFNEFDLEGQGIRKLISHLT